MLIASLRRHQQGMAFLIMQDDQSAAPKDFSKTSHQPAWNQVISVDGFPMSIDVENRGRAVCQRPSWSPERSSPACKSLGECIICPRFRQLCQKTLSVAIAIGERASGEQRQSLAAVATQIPGPS